MHFAIHEAAQNVIHDLKAEDTERWKELRDHFDAVSIMKHISRVVMQAKAADPNQRNLPELESLPLVITSKCATKLAEPLKYERYHLEVKQLEKRGQSYSNRRRKPENLAIDQRRLEGMK